MVAWMRGLISASMLVLPNQSAWAQPVIYVTPSQPIYYGGLQSSQNIYITGSANPEFVLYCDGVLGAFLYPQDNNQTIVVPQTGDLDSGSVVAALNLGDIIGPNPSALNPTYQWRNSAEEPTGASCLADQNSAGQIGNFYGKTAYIGFDLVEGGQNYYGWMEVQNPVDVAAGSIVEWAYSTSANTAIYAGGSVVPEPPVTTLLIFGIVLFLGLCKFGRATARDAQASRTPVPRWRVILPRN